jgi:hypothetical protein
LLQRKWYWYGTLAAWFTAADFVTSTTTLLMLSERTLPSLSLLPAARPGPSQAGSKR